MNREWLNACSGDVVDAAVAVHTALGPGLPASAYQACLTCELRIRGRSAVTQLPLPISYRDVRLDVGYRLDMLVDDAVVVELKSVEKLLPVHEAQLLSYLRLSGHRLGLLVNFNVPALAAGIRRMVNGL